MTAADGPSIVVDVGGTGTRLSLARDGVLVGDIVRFPTPTRRFQPEVDTATIRDALLDRVTSSVDALRHKDPDVRDVGVALGAVVDTDGVIRDASVLWQEAATGYDFRAALAERLPWARVRVLNDVTAAAWHYRDLGRYALVTVSTGVAVKAFDATLPEPVLLDPAGLGGEAGHVVVEPERLSRIPGGLARGAQLGRAAASGDPVAQTELATLGLPWCDCGAVADLCSYAAGPAVLREAARLGLPAEPASFAEAARCGDAAVTELLRDATRHLAAVLLQTCAGLGLSTVVVVGGFAHGVGEPWFAALRSNLTDLMVDAGWFRGWTAAMLADLVRAPLDGDDSTLAGMARYLAAQSGLVRRAVKPVGEGRLVVTTSPRPRCGREQFLLHIRYAGVCATDIQILRGERGYEPGVPGHECVAEVAEVGSAVPDLVPGTLVTLNPNHPTDDYLKLGHSVPGVFQDVLVGDLGLFASGQVVPLPADTGPAGVLVEPLAAVVRAAQLAPGRDVLIVGGGVLGLLHVAVAQAHGARTVVLATRSRDRLTAALARGASPPDAVVDLGPNPAPAIHAALSGRGADAVVVAVGGQRGPDVLADLWPVLADGAVVHLFGGFPSGQPVSTGDGPVDPGPLRAEAGRREVKNPAGGRVTLTGSRGGTAADFAAALDLKLDLTPYVSHIVSLAALPAVAAEMSSTGKVAGAPTLRVVVDTSLHDGWTG